MRNNRITSILITISILLAFVASPVSASDTVFTKNYSSDNFADGTNGWVVGESGEGCSAAIAVVDDEGATDGKALKITFPAIGAKYKDNDKYVVYGSVTKQGIGKGTEFSTDKELTIKLRVKKTSSDMTFQFKANRPNTLEQVGHDFQWDHFYSLFHQYAGAEGIAVLAESVLSVGNYGGDYWGFRGKATAPNSTKVDLTGKWVKYIIKFKPDEQSFYITTTYTDTDGTERVLSTNQTGVMKATKPELLKEYGEDFAYNKDIRQFFPGLESVTFTSRTAGDIYVDYVEIYGERDIITTSALLEKNYVGAKDALKLTFTTESDLNVLPEGAVYIDGVDSDVTYDKTTKTATLKPKVELIPGAQYVIKVDADYLYTDSGIIYDGETDLFFDVSDVSVSNLTATGRVIPGAVITSSYIYESSKPEGTHQFQWQISENGTDGWQDIDGATSKDFTVTDNEYGKYIRFEMTPYGLDEGGNNSYYGFETYSNVIIPEKAPVIENFRLSASTLFIDSYLSASYDYSDENGDEENGTEIIWYSSDSADAWAEIGRGLNYKITESDNGKYIKCTIIPKNNALYEHTGTEYYSEAAGPVADILESTNLIIQNADFETGDLTGYQWSSAAGWVGVEVTDKEAYSGEYSLHLNPRSAVQDSWGATVPLEYNNVYLFSCYAKKTSSKMQDITGFVPYLWSGTERYGTEAQATVSLTDRWQQVPGTFIATKDTTTTAGHLSWTSINSCDAYIDDMYFGELLVADIEIYNPEPTEIPESGKTLIPVTSGKVLNQLGTQHGLWNETVEIVIPEGLQGISVDGKNVVVDDTAVSASFTAELKCVPSYPGANQTVFRKFVDIDIISGSNVAPRADNVTAYGAVATGSTVTGTYDYYQVESKPDASTVKWMYSDEKNGTYKDIPGATSATYVVEETYADKYLKFAVTPKTEDGLMGKEAVSNYVTKERAPFAENVTVSGDYNIGGTLTAAYDFNDDNADDEGASLYKWYMSDSENGNYILIDGETSTTLTFTNEHKDKYFKFSVTPVSQAEPSVGTEVFSDVFRGPSAPAAENVKITRNNSRLIGSYDFTHIHNAKESGTAFEWIIDGNVVSNTIECEINFTGTKNVTFSVTPKAASNPATGKKVSVSAAVNGINGNTGSNAVVGGVVSGGGASGGFGGGGGSSSGSLSGGGSDDFTSGVISINDMDLSLPEKEETNTAEEESKSDISGHWGEKYIIEMISRGVIVPDENGNCQPDENVTRETMLTYLFKALELEETEYKNEFADVSESDFANMLQTMVDNGTIAKDDNFRPYDSISREEMCKILYISLNNADRLVEITEEVTDIFDDYGRISEWAKVYVNAIYGNKIMLGTSDTEFDPLGTVTKAQAATMLVRTLSLIEEDK